MHGKCRKQNLMYLLNIIRILIIVNTNTFIDLNKRPKLINY